MNNLAKPMMGTGDIRHVRLKPVRRAFAYQGYFWLIPMRAMARMSETDQESWAPVARNKRAALSFHDKDHGDGRANALSWLDELLLNAGMDVPAMQRGEVWLQTFPRVLGVVFKPVSFWWIHAENKALVAVVAEVNNTFGERHAYVLTVPRMGAQVQAAKVFHVSPFRQVRGQYKFRFMRTGDWGLPHESAARVVVRIDHEDESGDVLQTSQSGELVPLTHAAVRRVFWTHPLMTWGVIWRIHWQALQLWLSGVPFVKKPVPPKTAWSCGQINEDIKT